MYQFLFISISLMLVLNFGYAQAPVVNLTFDNCEATNTGPNSPDGEVSGSPDCVCGVFGSAFRFSGGEDAIAIPDTNVFRLLTFSIAFYFQPEKGVGDFTVLSHQEECNSLIGFSVLYRSTTNSLALEFTRDLGRRVVMNVDLPENQCWYHIIIERSGGRHSVFVDGDKLAEVNSGGLIEFANDAAISIGGGPCVPGFQQGMMGAIDEFRIYDRILNAAEKFQLRRDVHTILSSDTVVLVGSDIVVSVSDDCTESYFWSPTEGVETPSMGNTRISPPSSTTYFLEFAEAGCRVRDSISIIVVDPSDVTCNDLALPNAFTPNSDGLNDRFFISNPFLIEELLSFEIFDRSGSTMFKSTNPADSWDGNFRGEPVNPGVYLYKVEYRCDGEIFLKTGQVSVIR
jgi:gliding motility-associated-like protein